MKLKSTFKIASLILLFNAFVFSQELLRPNEIKKFTLQPDATKTLNLNLKKNDFAQISWTAQDTADFDYKIIAPSGKNLLDYAVSLENSFPFVALEDGVYRVETKLNKSESSTGEQSFSVKRESKFVLPSNAKLNANRKINGYDAKIYETTDEFGDSYLLIEKAGQLRYISKGSKFATGQHFVDEANKDDTPQMKRSATLFRTTPDATGDGAPDLAVEYFSGGAHCCYTMYFYELGDEVKPIKALATGDASIVAIGKDANGGLQLSSGDNTFAYWNTSFAGSPIPEIVLDFRDGEFRTNAKLMEKPAPPLAKLKREAAAIRAKMPLDAYQSDEDGGGTFDKAFWGRMLELIYSGHEDLAWQYFDWAWNPKKEGKDNFKRDFKAKLASSEFYQMFLTSKYPK